MHVLLANGVLNFEIFAVLQAVARKSAFRYAVLQEFCCAAWCWPRHRRNTAIGEVFSETREKASLGVRSFKAGASETLAVYPIIRYFLETAIASDDLKAEVQSFRSCCAILDHMLIAKRDCSKQNVERLTPCIRKFWADHLAAYGDTHIRPKHHYLWHIVDQPLADGFWLDCFTHERKHQCTKDCAQSIENTTGFEKSVLTTVLNCTIEHLK